MSQPQHNVLLVHATSHALRLESLLQAEGLTCKLIPVPRDIASDCGVCLRVCHQDLDAVLQIVERAGIELKGVHAV